MMPLRFARSDERACLFHGEESELHIWRNHRGGIVATGYRADGYFWMQWTCLALYRFGEAAADVTAFPEPGSPVDVIWDTYRRSVLPMALHTLGYEALHASAVMSPMGIVAFCATSETGKSTVAFGLRQRGCPQWADDGVVFRADQSPITAVPLPFTVRLREQSRRMFPDCAPQVPTVHANDFAEQCHRVPAQFAAI